MNGYSKADRYRDAYRSLNHREATVAEVDQALRIDDVAEATEIDPMLLAQITNANFLRLQAESIESFPARIAEVMDETLAGIKSAIPSGSETESRLRAIDTFTEKLDAAQQFVEKFVFPIIGVIACLCALVLFAFCFFTWRSGYEAGYSNRSDHRACAVLATLFDKANAKRDGGAKRFLGDALGTLQCPPR